jgi:G3E family GTPase
MNADSARIYLLMGRFASGKTTLIRRILAQQGQERYAIIQNEFA